MSSLLVDILPIAGTVWLVTNTKEQLDRHQYQLVTSWPGRHLSAQADEGGWKILLGRYFFSPLFLEFRSLSFMFGCTVEDIPLRSGYFLHASFFICIHLPGKHEAWIWLGYYFLLFPVFFAAPRLLMTKAKILRRQWCLLFTSVTASLANKTNISTAGKVANQL